MNIQRDKYVSQLISKSWNGKVKIITGIRRAGKSYLLSVLYKNHLLEQGATANQFIELDLERADNAAYRNPLRLLEFVKEQTKDLSTKYYVFIDEIQRSYKVLNSDVDKDQVPQEDREMLYVTFYDVLSTLVKMPNVDVYVTGSNSKMLSKDIVTNFRDRGTEIKVYPLSYQEYYSYSNLEKADALEQYLIYGGMPLAVLEDNAQEKQNYLSSLHKDVYMKDIVERYQLNNDTIMDALTDSIYSAIGSLSNPHKFAKLTGSLMGKNTSDNTIKGYLEMLEDSYLISSAARYDIKGKQYFDSIKKYYAMDLGLRNARLNFRQVERSHLMENLIYNELIRRGYQVDVGVVPQERVIGGKRQQIQYEVDFVVNKGFEKIYIQSALNINTPEKKEQETFSLKHIHDSFQKLIILDGNQPKWVDHDGVQYIGVIPFLLGD